MTENEEKEEIADQEALEEPEAPIAKDASSTNSKDPLHGVTLEALLTSLVERYGWETLGNAVNLRCFQENPTINSSLKFLRRNPWAREKVEHMYITNDVRPAWKKRGKGKARFKPSK